MTSVCSSSIASAKQREWRRKNFGHHIAELYSKSETCMNGPAADGSVRGLSLETDQSLFDASSAHAM